MLYYQRSLFRMNTSPLPVYQLQKYSHASSSKVFILFPTNRKIIPIPRWHYLIRTDVPLPGLITLCSRPHEAVDKLTLCSCPTGFVWTSCTPNLGRVSCGLPTNSFRWCALAIFQFANCFRAHNQWRYLLRIQPETTPKLPKKQYLCLPKAGKTIKEEESHFQLILPQSPKLRPQTASRHSLPKRNIESIPAWQLSGMQGVGERSTAPLGLCVDWRYDTTNATWLYTTAMWEMPSMQQAEYSTRGIYAANAT